MLETVMRFNLATAAKASRWAVILAGGNGSRLRSLTSLPKQFCKLIGGDTLLGHTRSRIARVIPAERTAYVVMQSHEPHYTQHLADVAADRVLAQPSDRGTTAAVVLALARIASADPEAVIGFFPADHYFADEGAFARSLERAYQLASVHSETVLLLGAQPEWPEVEYGWIEPESLTQGSPGLFGVNRFWEKPSAETARMLHDRGCLWNTFVMIGRAQAFLDVLRASVPAVLRAFEPLLHSRGRISDDAMARTYDAIEPGDFSKQVLSALPKRLAVLRLDNVGWSDLGTPERLTAVWERFGVSPLTAA